MKYIKYKIKNVEPLRIADDSSSQSGQSVTLRYIPGTTIRGYVVNSLANLLGDEFEHYKKALISDSCQVTYMNAYLYENEKELFPSPKGFYEDKRVAEGKKEIQNVVISGEFTDGFKRAGLGRFSYIENGCIYYYNVDTGSDLKILINKRKKDDEQNVFRNEYIAPGQTFAGCIAVKDDILADRIAEVIKDNIILGNARSQGLGKCMVIDKNIINEDYIPYAEYSVNGPAKEKCYMMLLSNTAMRNDMGEITGLDIKSLEEKLGVRNLRIEFCSTSVVNVKGYNRTWGSKIPSIMMYEQGSVFKLGFDGEASYENMKEIMKTGLGVRVNEGFGRVLFLKNYENVKYKLEGSVIEQDFISDSKHDSDDMNLKMIAKNYYKNMIKSKMQQRIVDGTDNISVRSQVGNVRALLEANRYDAIRGTKVIENYFNHAGNKEQNRKIQNQRASIKPFMEKILNILHNPLAETLHMEKKSVMGIDVGELLTADEEQRMKFDYILDLMRYENRVVSSDL